MYRLIISICIIIITTNNCIQVYGLNRPQNLPNEEVQLEQLQQIELSELAAARKD